MDAADPMVHCARFFYGPMLQGRDGIGACPCCGTGKLSALRLEIVAASFGAATVGVTRRVDLKGASLKQASPCLEKHSLHWKQSSVFVHRMSVSAGGQLCRCGLQAGHPGQHWWPGLWQHHGGLQHRHAPAELRLCHHVSARRRSKGKSVLASG